MGFAQMTHEWTNFFATVAQISGGLVGLVFVALTFNTRLLGSEKDPLLGLLARQTFADFLLLLMISLLMLVPHIPAQMIGAVILLLSLSDVGRVLLALWRWRARLLGHVRSWTLPQRFLLSMLGHAFFILAGFKLMYGTSAPLAIAVSTGSLLLSGVLMLMLSGCRSAWLLVTHEEK